MNTDQFYQISGILRPETIELKLTASTPEEVLEELVSFVPTVNSVTSLREKLVHALKEREQLYSTAIDPDIAIPHARNAIVGLVDQPVIVLGRSLEGIEFGYHDDTRIRLFFLLVAPNVRSHLQVLARLSRLLRSTALKTKLLTLQSAQEVSMAIAQAEKKLK